VDDRRIGIVAVAIGLAPLALITLASAIGCPMNSARIACSVLGSDVGSLVGKLLVFCRLLGSFSFGC